MWRVVLDYVVLTSALLNPHGAPARLLDFALQKRVRLFATQRMMSIEGRALRSKALRQWHGMTDRELARFIADLPVLFCLVPETGTLRDKRSLESELLSCAERSHADFLVISGASTPAATEQGGTQIVTADQLVKLVGRGVL